MTWTGENYFLIPPLNRGAQFMLHDNNTTDGNEMKIILLQMWVS